MISTLVSPAYARVVSLPLLPLEERDSIKQSLIRGFKITTMKTPESERDTDGPFKTEVTGSNGWGICFSKSDQSRELAFDTHRKLMDAIDYTGINFVHFMH